MSKASAFDGTAWIENQGFCLHGWVDMLMKNPGHRLRANRDAKEENAQEQMRSLQRGHIEPSVPTFMAFRSHPLPHGR